MSLLLEVRGLSKVFDHHGQQIQVLSGIDLDLQAGEQIAVVGSSGAGKSTLLHLLGTLDTPSSGSVRFDGKDVLALRSRALAAFRNRTIGFMFQFHHLLPEFTALENVMMPSLIRRVAKAKARKEAQEWLDQVGLAERMSHRPGELSGGEQQRVALARALSGRPRLLLADEPTGNLDGKTSDGIHALFQRINSEHGTAMLIVTHNLELARRLPRVMRMTEGGLLEDEAA